MKQPKIYKKVLQIYKISQKESLMFSKYTNNLV